MPSKMRPLGKTIALEEARAIIDSRRPAARPHREGAARAGQRTRPRRARHLRRRRSALLARGDGRLRSKSGGHHGASPTTPSRLRRRDKSSPDRFRRRIGAGESAEIATGAPLPEGADAVVMVEETDGRRDRRDVGVHSGLSTTEHRPTGRRHPDGPDGPARGRRS